MQKRWIDPEPIDIPAALQSLDLHPLVLETLARLGHTDPQQAQRFLDPASYQPAPPQDLPDLAIAVERIETAIQENEKLLVWGDFDVDGQTATALLVSGLEALGANVTFHIPDRNTEGHGIHVEKLGSLLNDGHHILLTCDTGIAAHDAVDYAQQRGVDVIITDHHQLTETLPDAYAVINPQRLAAGHPLRTLPGVGVAYKLIEALYQDADRAGELNTYLDLVALGIVADVAEQIGDTRYLLQRGLEVLRNTIRLGLSAIMDLAKIDRTQLDEETIGFQIGPRLNALGRLSDANIAIELLTTQNNERARILAAQIDGLNEQRKSETNQVYQAAEQMIESDPELLDSSVLIAAHPNWPGGIIGIVANRLVERYQRPVILLRIEGGIARGSARSVPGCDITAAISQHADLLLNYGGHTMAAGLSLPLENLDTLRRKLSQTVTDMLDAADLTPTLPITAYVKLSDISDQLLQAQNQLKPFGPGNPAPTLAARQLILNNARQLGRKPDHQKLTVSDTDGTIRDVVWWQAVLEQLPPGRFDLAFTISENTYKDQREIQITLVDIRPVDEEPMEFAHRRQVEIIDYRGLSLDEQMSHLNNLDDDCIIWAEGKSLDNDRAIRRDQLHPASTLAIWSAPPSLDDLQTALDTVNPARVILFDTLPGTDSVQGFLQRFGGLIKNTLNNKDGKTTIAALAGAMAHRPATIRTALAWMITRGHITTQIDDGENLTLVDGGESNKAAQTETTTRLAQQIQEAAAFRAHFRKARAVTLIQPSTI